MTFADILSIFNIVVLLASAGISARVAIAASKIDRDRMSIELGKELGIRAMLQTAKYSSRSLKRIREVHYPWMEENDLRELLLRAGAVRFPSGRDGELWGLPERNARWFGGAGDGDKPKRR
jgi:hypothetical protein